MFKLVLICLLVLENDVVAESDSGWPTLATSARCADTIPAITDAVNNVC